MPSTATTVTTLARQLKQLGAAALRRHSARRLYRFVESPDCESMADLRALSESCAFETFIDLGGNVETWQTFDWVTHHDRLISETSRRMVYLLQNGDSGYMDWYMRQQTRKNPAVNQAWDAWRRGAVTRSAGRAIGHTGYTGGHAPKTSREMYMDETDQATASLIEAKLAELLPALKAVLTPYEFGIMKRRYIDGVSGPDLAREMAASDVNLRGHANPVKLAEQRIWKTVERAKIRAREALAGHWAQLAKEIA